ncbi:3-hydroxyacyl-CoA dehydrogenase [Streptomyces sp. NPDC055078]
MAAGTGPGADGPLTVAVVGAGTMGRGIAQLFAMGGHRVLLTDERPGAADEALAFAHRMIDRSAAKGLLDDPGAARARLGVVDEITSADLVIEAVVEDLDVKRRLLAGLEARLGPDTVFATNTSSLSVTAIGAGLARPERLCGLHFFNPVPLMRLVEIVPGEHTGPAVAGRLARLVGGLGHTPLTVSDTPGFLVNHAGRPYTSEAVRLLDEKVASAPDIDRVCREAAGFRMGPFELMDLTGLDINMAVSESVYRGFADDPRFRPSPTVARMVTAGRLGRKTGHGFHTYATGPGGNLPAGASGYSARTGGDSPDAGPGTGSRDGTPAYGGTPVWCEDVRLASLLRGSGVTIAPRPGRDTVAIVSPWGQDVTGAGLDAGLPPERTVGADPFGQYGGRLTLAAGPAASHATVTEAHAALAATGREVSVVSDGAGFIAQRIAAVIVNTACEIAQQGLASPADIDTAVTLGLGYPYGPLAWGDRIGATALLRTLEGLYAAYRDPRYRPSVWLTRRARLGVPLSTGDFSGTRI